MKRKITKHRSNYVDVEQSFDDWYYSDQGQDQSREFIEMLEDLVRAKYDVEDFFEEPSTQGYQGSDFISITLSDGSQYEFEFDWYDEIFDIYTFGPEAVAKAYFNYMKEDIDSRSALVKE